MGEAPSLTPLGIQNKMQPSTFVDMDVWMCVPANHPPSHPASINHAIYMVNINHMRLMVTTLTISSLWLPINHISTMVNWINEKMSDWVGGIDT